MYTDVRCSSCKQLFKNLSKGQKSFAGREKVIIIHANCFEKDYPNGLTGGLSAVVVQDDANTGITGCWIA